MKAMISGYEYVSMGGKCVPQSEYVVRIKLLNSSYWRYVP